MGLFKLFSRSAAMILAVSLATATAAAGEVDVMAVDARQAADGSWTFSVTLRHDDEGWDHYADRWDVVGPDGTVYGERVLLHPHVEEQPFMRGLSGVAIPEGVHSVIVRGHDKVHGLGGAELTIDLQAGE
ncbi:hypothetical protein AAFN47_01565 [Hoeflea sp. CAU 1731]